MSLKEFRLKDIFTEVNKYYPDVQFVGIGDDNLLLTYPILVNILGELVSNCVEVENPAHRVTVTIEGKTITVEDDIKYDPSSVETILNNVNNLIPHTTRPRDEKGFADGGVGILASRRHLAKINGTLNYFEKESGIVARVELC